MASLRLAVDIGGTFTDIYALDDETHETLVRKVPSTPLAPIDALMRGVREAGISWSDVTSLVHGTTVATNALITRSFPPAAMITTAGFRDVIEIRRGTKQDLWDTYTDVAPPYIRRRDRFTVEERIDEAGTVVTPLNEDDVRRVAGILRRRGIATVAVCLINSYANARHERRIAELLAEELPDVTVCLSTDVAPEIFEHERFSTAVANAVLTPSISAYVDQLQRDTREAGYERDVLILHSGGGVMTPETAKDYAVRLAASGLAAGAVATQSIAQRAGYQHAIGLDMGGTSTDVTLIYDGEPRMVNEWHVEYGYPILFPSVEVLTVGAGGGSIAWIDDAGSLRNGPQSAGASPGPACYGEGGDVPTNTDANVVLGRSPASLLDGAIALDPSRAERAIDGIGQQLGMDVTQTAAAIIDVANASMADAVRVLSVRRGYDPRDFVLVACGGAGPLHGAAVAQELAIPTVLVPPTPGITSAFGCLLVDVRHDFSRLCLGRLETLAPTDIEQYFADLEHDARERLRSEGVPDARIRLIRTIDMRYAGQWRSLAVPVEGPVRDTEGLSEAFHELHAREHAYRRDGAPVEVYRLNVTAVGVMDKPAAAPATLEPDHVARPADHRDVVFGADQPAHRTPVYRRGDLRPGATIAGPAVIEQLDSTILVPPRTTAAVDEWWNVKIDVREVIA